VTFQEPLRNGKIQFIESSRKKMVCATYEDNPIVAGRYRQYLFHMLPGAVLIAGALHNQFRLAAPREIRKIRIIHRNAHSQEFTYATICATHSQSHPTAETEARH